MTRPQCPQLGVDSVCPFNFTLSSQTLFMSPTADPQTVTAGITSCYLCRLLFTFCLTNGKPPECGNNGGSRDLLHSVERLTSYNGWREANDYRDIIRMIIISTTTEPLSGQEDSRPPSALIAR
ncbi:hypothetical protein JTB14_028851 [Gonioctena quinquepunctata]|nr:hypothetical protein JTB14_028851 [Gonioctena quinquepunctata]